MTTTTQQTETTASQYLHSDAVSGAFDTIIGELKRRQSGITGVRGPDKECRVEFDKLAQALVGARGRGLYYDYIASGIGNGALVELVDGSVKWDMISGIGALFFGHSDPDLVRTALEAAAGDTVMQGHLQMNADAILFAESLVSYASRTSELAHCFFSTSGAMANENALKIAYQKHQPAERVLAFSHCFMGRTTVMAQIGDSAAGRDGIPLNMHIDYMPFYDEALERLMRAGDHSAKTHAIDTTVRQLERYIERYPKQHTCFVFELVQGEGGFNTAPPEFHRALMEVCRANDIAVWADEIQTFGRTESLFAFEALGLGEYIDLCTVGKMTQTCGTLFTERYNPKPGLLSGTFLGGSAALRVGRRLVDRLVEGDYYGPDGRIARHHKAFVEHVGAIKSRHPEWFPDVVGVPSTTGGTGGMMRFTPFGGDKDKVMKLCKTLFEEGVICFYCGHGPYHVRMLPPLGVFRMEDWPKVFEIVERSMARVAG
ncbi:MAG: aminotransferase class III-fold pyridoxal phosphate-dependent enzyme [Phycisphaeraceae bacterium]|nr:aminotransferase class III-fold pyridoxal phosphate-dependent enzyme [Phycisphaeraceae bacterium]